jgi:Domain of unknown function (DUF4262)
MSQDELSEFHRRTAAHIEREGRSIVGVFAADEDDGPPFSYTIGNHLKGLPELLVTIRSPPRTSILTDSH